MVPANVLCGGVQLVTNPGQSLGEIFYTTLKNAPNSTKEILVDALTKESFTIEDVFRKSVQVASKLYEYGVRRGDMVGIVSENRVDYVFPVIGCFYLGATINPLNPDYLSREIKHAFEITKPKVVISSALKLEEVTQTKLEVDFIETVITFEDLNDDSGKIDFKELESKLQIAKGLDTSQHMAMVLCSSGTTGLPKGVAITHENVRYCFIHMNSNDAFGLDDKEVLIAMLPFYHILGLMTLIGCILCNGKAVVLSKFKPDVFMQTIEAYKITKLFLVPPLALFLAKNPMTEKYDLSSITDMVCGAAPLGAETQSALEEKLGIPVRQAYGLTETCAASLTPSGTRLYPGSSGKVLVNVQAKIVDLESNQTVGANKLGEICLKGRTTMKCYLGNEKATKEIFDQDGFLRTGDIGYYNEDGFFYIVDRLKELIKYKGFQVPPAELEEILMQHKEIKDAAVIGIPDERSGELAKAFVVKVENSHLTEDDVKAYVAKHVSIQKQLHGGVEFIDVIPKSAAGKILRKDLRQLANKQ